MRPDAPIRLVLQASLADDRLLAGAVPQPADWLRAWQAVRHPKSWQAAAAGAATEHFIHQIRARPVQPRAFAALVEIMREAIRNAKRANIREATSIFIGVDDRGSRKIVRYRCDAPAALAAPQGPQEGLGKQRAHMGILGCAESVHGHTFQDFEGDYGERVAGDIVRMIERFCTPLGDRLDEQLCQHFLRSVRGFVADGALQKVGHVLKSSGRMPNLLVVLRDPCHMIRIACKDPLHATGRFADQYERLFGKHGL